MSRWREGTSREPPHHTLVPTWTLYAPGGERVLARVIRRGEAGYEVQTYLPEAAGQFFGLRHGNRCPGEGTVILPCDLASAKAHAEAVLGEKMGLVH